MLTKTLQSRIPDPKIDIYNVCSIIQKYPFRNFLVLPAEKKEREKRKIPNLIFALEKA